MRLLSLFFFLILLSCGGKKNYVCGDRLCLDKKEYNEYFAANLSIEVISEKKKRKKTVNLVKLNSSTNLDNDEVKSSKKQEKLRIKLEKEKIKTEKIRLKEERKAKKAEEKIKKKEEKKFANTSKPSEEKKETLGRDITIKQNKNNIPVIRNNKNKASNRKNICDEVKDCDIDKIAEMLIKKGKNKPFPKISSN